MPRNLFIILLILCVFPTFAFADAAQERRLTISASIFPKIVALDENLASKTNTDGAISLGVIYVNDKEKAEKITGIIRKKVKNLAGFDTSLRTISLPQTLQDSDKAYAGLLITEMLTDEDFARLVSHTTKHSILLFSPFNGDIERGAASSIFVGAKIRPYFNLTTLKKSNISLKPAILKVSKTYE